MSSTKPPDNVRQLGVVPKLRADDECRESSLSALRKALERAETGDVSEVMIILRHPGPDKEYSVLASETQHMSDWIGQMEQLKFDWQMHAYLAAKDEGAI